jgi:hypothetical protein
MRLPKKQLEYMKDISICEVRTHFFSMQRKIDIIERALIDNIQEYYDSQYDKFEDGKNNIYNYLMTNGLEIHKIKSSIKKLDEYNLVLNYKDYMKKLSDITERDVNIDNYSINKLELKFSDPCFTDMCQSEMLPEIPNLIGSINFDYVGKEDTDIGDVDICPKCFSSTTKCVTDTDTDVTDTDTDDVTNNNNIKEHKENKE